MLKSRFFKILVASTVLVLIVLVAFAVPSRQVKGAGDNQVGSFSRPWVSPIESYVQNSKAEANLAIEPASSSASPADEHIRNYIRVHAMVVSRPWVYHEGYVPYSKAEANLGFDPTDYYSRHPSQAPLFISGR